MPRSGRDFWRKILTLPSPQKQPTRPQDGPEGTPPTAPPTQQTEGFVQGRAQVEDLIIEAAKLRRVVEIYYELDKCRHIEPYSLRSSSRGGGTGSRRGMPYLFALCREHAGAVKNPKRANDPTAPRQSGIHSFLFDRIIKARMTDSVYTPRWEVELDNL